jgi:hypothetical protein
VLDYVPGWWIGELYMVHDAQLFILQSHKQHWSWLAERNGTTFLSAGQHKEAFYGLGVQDVIEFDSD